MIAIFANRSALCAILPLSSGVKVGKPIQCVDGRMAISHDFSEEDQLELQKSKAILVKKIPSDWKYGTFIDPDYAQIRDSIQKIFKSWETSYEMPYVSATDTLGTWLANTKIPALPYSSVTYACNDILYNKNLSSFYSATLNPASVLYTDVGGNGVDNRASVWGVVCSSVVCYLSGQDIYYITLELENILDFYDYITPCGLCVGDSMLKDGHIKIISNILYNDDATVNMIEITEAWIPLTRKTLYTIQNFEKQLVKYGGDYRLGRFPSYKPRTLEKIEFATDCIPNHGDKGIYKDGEEIWLYVTIATDTIYYKKVSDSEYVSVALSSLPSSIINGVTVYNVTNLLSTDGMWNVTTNPSNAIISKALICTTGTVAINGNSFSVSGYSADITPLWYQILKFNPGISQEYDFPSPDGYETSMVYGSKKLIENPATETFEIPTATGYYLRVHFKTTHGQVFKDSDYVFITH